MADENQTDSVPSAAVSLLCANGCGFYGSPSTLNLCSKCFNDHQKRTANAHDAPPAPEENSNPQPDTAALSGKPAPSVTAATSVPPVVAAAAAAVAASAPTSEPLPEDSRPKEKAVHAVEPKDDAETPAPVNQNGAKPALVVDGTKVEVTTEELKKDDSELPVRKVQKNTSRCFSCRKKVGLTGFKCRCDYVYCATHRYADAHECDFDYKTAGREQISKDNPLVVAAKLQKI